MIKANHITYIFLFVLLLSIYSCRNMDKQNSKAITEENDTFVLSNEDTLKSTIRSNQLSRKDTTIFINGDTISVKYEENDNYVDIVIIKNGVRFKWYSRDTSCMGYYPWFEFANEHIVCFARSCGGYCTSFYFINCDTWEEVERENVLCETENKKIIAYYDWKQDKIVVEKLFHWKKKFTLKHEIPCYSAHWDCIDTVYFNNQELFLSYTNYHDEIVFEKFKW